MPRYRAQMKFLGWRVGDEFESVDPWYAQLAREGRLVVELPPAGEEGRDGEPVDQVQRG